MKGNTKNIQAKKSINNMYKKRARLFIFLLIIGFVLFVTAMCAVLYRDVRREEQDELNRFFSTIGFAFSNNSEEYMAVKNDFQKTNEMFLTDLSEALADGGIKSIEAMDVNDASSMLLQATRVMKNCAWICVHDEKGIVKASSVSLNVGINISDSIPGDRYSQLIKGETPYVVIDNPYNEEVYKSDDEYEYENYGEKLYLYDTRIDGFAADGGRRYLIMAFGSAHLDSISKSLENYDNWINTESIGDSGIAFLVDGYTHTILHCDNELLQCEGKKSEEIGFSNAMLKDGYSGIREIDGIRYYFATKQYQSDIYGKNYLIAGLPAKQVYFEVLSTLIVVVAFMIITATVITLYSTYVRMMSLKKQEDLRTVRMFKTKNHVYYFSKYLAAKIIPIALVCVLITFFVNWYMMALMRVTGAFSESISIQNNIEYRLEDSKKSFDDFSKYYSIQNTGRASLLAYMVSLHGDTFFTFNKNDPDVHKYSEIDQKGRRKDLLDCYNNPVYSRARSEQLNYLAMKNDLEAIFIYDENGHMIVSNTNLWKFSLGEDEDKQSHEFWQILDGDKDVIEQKIQINDMGELHQYVGCAMHYYTSLSEDGETVYHSYHDYASQSEGTWSGNTITPHVGLLQVELKTKDAGKMIDSAKVEYIIKNTEVSHDGFLLCFERNQGQEDEHIVVYSPHTDDIGKAASDIGVAENAFSGNYNGFQNVNGVNYLQCYRPVGDYYVATAVDTRKMYESCLMVSVVTALITFVVLLLVTFYMLIITDMNSEELRLEETDPFAILGHIHNKYGAKVKNGELREMAKKLFVCFFLVLLAMGFYSRNQNDSNNTAMTYIFSGNWDRGIHIFSLTAIVLLAGIAAVVIYFLRRLFLLISDSFDSRVRTLNHLFFLIAKGTIIVAIILIDLYFLGVNTSSLFASAGVLTVVVGIGAQSVIGDILAGIFIVIEGYIHVGDFLTVDDFRGEVIEIGIRTTKLEDDHQNIKVINNNLLTSIVNMSRKHTRIYMNIPISYDESVDRVKEVFEREWPSFPKRIKSLKSVPYIEGVQEFADSSVNLTVTVLCDERYRLTAERQFNDEMLRVMNENNIEIPFTQIDIHSK